jgi:hypothetical protein
MVTRVSAARRRLLRTAALAAALQSAATALALAGCGAKVKPPIFEEDDPRAARAAAVAPDDSADEDAADGADTGAGARLDAPAAPARSGPSAAPATPPADPTAATAEVTRRSRQRPLAPPGAHPRTGAIDRLALLRVLDAGPGGLLRAVEVSPFFEGSRFLGWRLDQIVDASSPLAGVDLAAGDVILAVNRRPVARPEHVMAIWQELRGADELVCQVWRGAAAFELRFAITPKATPAQTAPPPPPARPPAATQAQVAPPAAAPPPRR